MPLFTVLIDTYYRPQFLRESVESLLGQTLKDLEIIIIDNGSTPETKVMIKELMALDSRIRQIVFDENQFSWDDPLKMLDSCLNAGLQEAKGEFIWYQADDDYISANYLERMYKLFQENPQCTSAAGLPVGVNIDKDIITPPAQRKSNFRPRYMPGKDLALRLLKGKNSLFSAPGTIFTFRKSDLIKCGGFDRSIELQQLYGIVPFGDTGFDEEAHLYWRYHDSQLNKMLNQRGFVSHPYYFSMISRCKIHEKWQENYGKEVADSTLHDLSSSQLEGAAAIFIMNLLSFKFKACFNSLKASYKHYHFWHYLPHKIWFYKRHFLSQIKGLLLGNRLSSKRGNN